MRQMLDVLRNTDWRELVADIIGLACLCVTLYLLTIIGAALLPVAR